MTTIQEYFDSAYEKDKKEIFLDSKSINVELVGSDLVIEGFETLEYISISNLSGLAKIKVKDCKVLNFLEINLENQVEVDLENCPKIKIKIGNINTKPTVIYQNNTGEGVCWGCIGFAFSLAGISILGVVCFYLAKKIQELREYIKKLQGK